MNGNSSVVDTNILIFLLNGDKNLLPLLEDSSISISVISEIELYCSKKLTLDDEDIIRRLILQTKVIELNPELKQEIIYFRKKYEIKLPDAFVAATASYLRLPLITSDKIFKKINELSIIYYEVA